MKKTEDKQDLDNILVRLKALRKGLGLSQAKVAERLNITQYNFSRIEIGSIKLTVDILLKICNIYNIKLMIKDMHFEISAMEDSPNIISFKEACKKALNEYKKEFVKIDLNTGSNKLTLILLFTNVQNSAFIPQGERNIFRLLYTELRPQIKNGYVELDTESLSFVKAMLSFVLSDANMPNDLLEDFKALELTIDNHITDKTNHLIIKNNE